MGVAIVRAEVVYREELAKIGAEDARVVCVEALPRGALHPFEAAHPDRFFPLGSVESAMVSMVEGLVTAGFRVFVCGLGDAAREARLPRLALAYLRVGASVVVPDIEDGPAELLGVPRLRIAAPSGVHEIRSVVRMAVRSGRPHHIRIGAGAPADVTADWTGADDGEIPPVVWGAGPESGEPADARVCLVSVGEDGTRLALAARERYAGVAHAHLVYVDDGHLAAAAGQMARHYDRFVVLGGWQGPQGVRQRLSRLMPGCAVFGVALEGELGAGVDQVLASVEGLRR
ncbi:transketolase [Streptomyces sp. SID5785]|uniref:transketolase n=1 Tax=Streptomyces sp. SID5785 TaxID=2690309 RepID=UPI001361B59F|nr:transketolase [Streptomyces sp. SID5785]MZD06782.1 transketolase [Streptomyces sp. SID5785]MZD09671.1 transketolase [Streptomyces sp. SID5785]